MSDLSYDPGKINLACERMSIAVGSMVEAEMVKFRKDTGIDPSDVIVVLDTFLVFGETIERRTFSHVTVSANVTHSASVPVPPSFHPCLG